MITAYFGCPGCGKSSIITLIAQKELDKIKKGKSKYKYVFTNFPCSGTYKFDILDLDDFYFHDSLLILDEATLSADSRTWKTFPHKVQEFICLHRHQDCDIIYTCQDYSRVEKSIRQNTVELYYVSRFFHWAKATPIYRTIAINDYISDLIMGYRFPDFFESLGGTKYFYIKKAWKFFNSYDHYGFDKLPDPNLIKW